MSATVEIKATHKLSELMTDEKRKEFFVSLQEALTSKIGIAKQENATKLLVKLFGAYPQTVTEKLEKYIIEYSVNGKTLVASWDDIFSFVQKCDEAYNLQDKLLGVCDSAPITADPKDW